jgi:hypothetical protein
VRSRWCTNQSCFTASWYIAKQLMFAPAPGTRYYDASKLLAPERVHQPTRRLRLLPVGSVDLSVPRLTVICSTPRTAGEGPPVDAQDKNRHMGTPEDTRASSLHTTPTMFNTLQLATVQKWWWRCHQPTSSFSREWAKRDRVWYSSTSRVNPRSEDRIHEASNSGGNLMAGGLTQVGEGSAGAGERTEPARPRRTWGMVVCNWVSTSYRDTRQLRCPQQLST